MVREQLLQCFVQTIGWMLFIKAAYCTDLTGWFQLEGCSSWCRHPVALLAQENRPAPLSLHMFQLLLERSKSISIFTRFIQAGHCTRLSLKPSLSQSRQQSSNSCPWGPAAQPSARLEKLTHHLTHSIVTHSPNQCANCCSAAVKLGSLRFNLSLYFGASL